MGVGLALDVAAPLPAEDWRRGMLTTVARWLDEAALTSLCWAFDRTLADASEDAARVEASLLPYVTPALNRDPAAFFSFMARTSDAEPVSTVPVRRLADGWLVTHAFASEYECHDRARRDEEACCAENAMVPVHHWMHDDGRAHGTVIALHGFTMGHPRVDAVVLQAARWYAAGLDVVLPTLPFHGTRSPRFARHSGALFGSWDVGRLNEAVRQSVWDVHRVHGWLRRASARPVGLFGISLGGYVSALLAELCDAWDFVLAVAPAVCLASLPCRLLARSRHARRAGPPIDIEALRAGYRVHSPLTHRLRVARERVLLVAGRGDRVVPPAHAHALWRHWNEPEIIWFSGSHFAPFRRGLIFAAGLGHLARLGLLG
jgi:hypothetical protein